MNPHGNRNDFRVENNMPGPVSDSYDPEWGTSAVRDQIDEQLEEVYARLSGILGGKEPIFVGELINTELDTPIAATLTEKEWRMLRFAVERARDCL